MRDPEIPVDIVNLGLVYAAAAVPLEDGAHRIDVRMSLTAPGCSMSDVIKAEVERKLAALPEVREVHVEIVFDPPWNASMMSEGAKLQLGFDSDYGSTSAASLGCRELPGAVQSRSLACWQQLTSKILNAESQLFLFAALALSICLRQSRESTKPLELRQPGSTMMCSSR